MLQDWGEYRVGNRVRTQGRTLTESEFTMLVNLTWENGPLHTDDEYMSTTPYGKRMLGGPCLMALMAGLVTPPLRAMLGRARLSTVAALGVDNVRYHAPFHVGDTLTVEIEVLELRESKSRPGQLVGKIRETAVKQDGQVVLTMEPAYLYRRME